MIRSNLSVRSNSLSASFLSLGISLRPVPASPVIVKVGIVVYPLPLLVIFTAIIALPFVIATAVACTPPSTFGALIVIFGSTIYPVPAV